jgi:hypothetical protein
MKTHLFTTLLASTALSAVHGQCSIEQGGGRVDFLGDTAQFKVRLYYESEWQVYTRKRMVLTFLSLLSVLPSFLRW